MGESIHVEVIGADRLIRALTRVEKATPENMYNALKAASVMVRQASRQEVVKAKKVFTGKLEKSIIFRVSKSGKDLTSTIGPRDNQLVGAVIHFGRTPGAKQPPIDPIRAWIVAHGMPASAAFPLARKIGQSGLSGQPWPFMQSGFDSVRNEVITILSRVADSFVINVVRD